MYWKSKGDILLYLPLHDSTVGEKRIVCRLRFKKKKKRIKAETPCLAPEGNVYTSHKFALCFAYSTEIYIA